MQQPLFNQFSSVPPSPRWVSSLARVLAVLALLLSSSAAWAQLTGAKTIAASGGDYTSVAAAITALNASGVGAGGVVFSVPAGWTETFATATAGQITLSSTSANPASAANPVAFQKSGSGANPVLTSAGSTGSYDAVLSVVGTDYVTFSNIDVADAGSTVEFGYALFRASATDGSQNISITGATITLNKANTNTIGIYSPALGATGTAYTSSSAAGANSSNSFTGIAIANSFKGINVTGATATVANMDTNNIIGGLGTAKANTMTNLGGSDVAVYGVSADYQSGLSIVNNTITIPAGNTTTYATGIYTGAASPTGMVGSLTISGNTVKITSAPTSSGAYIGGIRQLGTSALTTVTIANNVMSGWSITGSSVYYVFFVEDLSSSTGLTSTITGNSITSNSVNTGFYIYGIARAGSGLASTSSGTATIAGNTISGNTFAIVAAGSYIFCTFSTGTTVSLGTAGNGNLIANNTFPHTVGTAYTFLLYNSATTVSVVANTVTNNTATLSNTGTAYPALSGYYDYSSGPVTQTITGNTFTGLTINGTGTSNNLYGIFSQATGVKTISGNTIGNLTSGTSGGSIYGAINGIYFSTGSTVLLTQNKVYGLTAYNSGSSGAQGINIAGGTTVMAANNIVGGISVPNLSSTTALDGIQVSGGTTVNLYYNTVFLNATSTATNFGTSDIRVSSTTPTVTLINNLVDNKSTAAGTGTTVALRWSAAPGTRYGSASNNNLYYSTGPLYSDGTSSYSTLATLKAGVTPRETVSVTEDVAFANTSTGASANYLHIAAGTSTYAESNGQIISTYATDYDNDARGSYAGATIPYLVNGVAQANGGGAAPDLGADEGDFAPKDVVTVSNTQYTQITATVGQGALTQLAASLIVTATGTTPSSKLTSLTVNLGSSTPADIAAVYLYSSPTATFSAATATLVPSTNTLGAGSTFTVTATNGSAPTTGTTYYFVVYDIATTAGAGDQIATTIASVTIGGTVYTPTLSGPAGFLSVVDALAGTYYIDPNNSHSNVARTYATFTAAVNDLNLRGTKANVVFDVAPGVTFLEGGALVPMITTSGTSAKTITFERDPDTGTFASTLADPILQPTGGTGAYDAALALAGGDYFTFTHLTISQPSASTALEYGIGLFRASASNGAQSNTVQNCTITLSTANANSVGIYGGTITSAGVAVATNSATGANSNNTIISNTVAGAVSGIVLNGYNNASYYDLNNSIGGAAAVSATTGNTISGLGAATATSYGVYASYQSGAQLNNNTVSGSATGAAIYGIYQDVSTATDVAMSYNNVTLSEAGSFAITGVYNNAAGATGNTLTLSNNTVSLTNSAATPSATTGVYSATTASTTATAIALSGNLVTLNISNVTGSPTSTMAGVYNVTAAGSVTLSNNKVSETATETGTGSYNSPNYGVWNTGAANSATGTLALSGNVVSATASNSAGGGFGSSTLGFGGVYNTGAAANTAALSGNGYTFAITLGSTAGANEPVYGVYNSGAVTGALAMNSNILSLSPTVNATANGYSGGTYYGVYNTGTIAATGSLTMTGNQPSLTAVSGAVSFAPSFYGVYNNGAVNSTSTTAANLSNNNVANTTTLGAASSSAGFYGVSNGSSVSGGLTLSSNTLNASTTYNGAGVLSGVFYGIYNNGTIAGSATFSSNNVLTTAGSSYRTTGVIGLLYSSGTVNGSQLTISGNTFGPASGTAATLGSGSGAAYALFNSNSSSATVAVSGNTAQNLNYAGTGTLSGYLGSAASAGAYSVTQNTLLTLSSVGSLTGISVAGTTGTVSSNKLAGLTGTASGSVVTGIAVTAASTGATVQNNLIGNLAAPAAISSTAIVGINVSGGNLVNLYYNTVYLNASSSSASFGSSGIYLSSTTPTVTLINNLIDNKSVAGTSGFTVALRRTAAAFTGYGSTSNYNLYYAGTPGTANLLYYDGTNSYQTLAALKTAVAARETRSQTEDVPFASVTGSDAAFLHISPTAATIVESSGVVISSIATDYDSQARGPYTGSASPYAVNGVSQANGGGASPDLGADEGDFVPQPITVQSLTYNRLNATVGVGAANQAAVGLTIVASVGSPTLKLSSLNIALLLGTTTSTTSFTNPKLYLSSTSTFDINTATLLPTTGTPAAAYTLALTNATQLFSGSNYFFLTYDVAGTAVDGDQVSSNITAATIGGTVYNSSSTPPVQSSGATGFLMVSGPLAGMYYIDPNALTNPTRTYPTFTAAINDLNVRGLGAAVTFEVAPGQTYLEGGSLVPVITATGTSTNTIAFERDPNTTIFPTSLTDPLLQPMGGVGAYDAALAVGGGDYITFSRLSISQPSASTALEYGVALFRTSASNGAQNNTVQNCTITLSNTNANTKGIYSVPATAAAPGTTLTITAGGQNSNNKFLGNTITNVAAGIYLAGYNDATVYDTGNSIGGTAGAATGNTVTNFGTAGTTVYGIYASYQAGALLNNNTVNNTAGSGTAATATLYGIYQDASTATDVAMSSNTVALTQSVTATAAATYPVYGMYNTAAGAAANTATLSNNSVTLSVTTNNSAANLGAVAAVYNNATSGSVTMSGNTTTETVANTAAGSFNGNIYGVINATPATSSTGALTMSGNTTRLTLTVSAGGGFGATSTPGFSGIYNGGTAANTAALSNNAFTFATTIGGTAGVGASTYGVFNAGAITTSLAMTGNTVTATPTTTATSYGWNAAALYGVANTGAVSATAATLTLTGNTVTASPSLASTNAPYQSFYGVYNTGTVSGASSATTLSTNNVTYTLTLPGTVAASSSNNAYGVYNSGTMGGPLTESGNTVVLTPVLTSSGGYPGSLYGVYNAGTISSTGTLTMNGNTASTAPVLSGSGAYSGNACGLFASGTISNTGAAALAVNSNTVNITPTLSSTGALSGTQYGLYIAAANSGSQVVSGNTVSASPTLSSTGVMSGAYVGIYNVSSGTVGGNQTVTGNTVNATSSVANASTLTGTLYGIYSANTVTGNQVITNNNVLTNVGAAYPTTGAVATFYNTVAPGGTQTITGNTVGPTATPGSANLATNSTSYLFYNSNAPIGATTFSNNVLRNLTSSGTGSLYGYYNYGGPTSDFTADQNSFSNLTMSTATAGLFGVFLGTSSSQKQTVTNNTFTNLAAGTASPQAGVTNESFAIFAYYGAATSQVSGNTVNGFTTNGSGALTGIHLGTSMAGGSVYLNTVSSLTSSGVGIVNGLLSEATAPVLYRNKVYGLSGTNASSVVRGISVTAGTTTAVQNNVVGTLTAPAATSSTAIAGLSITGGTTVNVYYNTVYLNASSSGGAFGTAGIYASTTPTLTLLNNLVTNLSTPGSTGRAVAYQRSSSTLTSYAAASNTNLFYVTGTPSATQAIYYDGTTTYQTMADYRIGMATREQASVSDAVTYLSTTGSNSTFLHLDPSVATRAEGRATPISGITDDFDGEVRSASTPDIGADEFNGTPLPVVLTRFDAVRQSENAALSWNTASETNNKGFEVQVSTDGQTFRVLGFVAAATANSATAHNYAYLDKEAGKIGLRYYRLNQVDLSGKSAFSPVRIVDFGQMAAAISLTAMPNPFSSQFTVSVQAATAIDNCQLLLTDASGRTVLTQQVTLAVGITDVKVANLEALATGMYVLHLTIDGQVKHVKVVKE